MCSRDRQPEHLRVRRLPVPPPTYRERRCRDRVPNLEAYGATIRMAVDDLYPYSKKLCSCLRERPT
jgi:hypothetical protein